MSNAFDVTVIGSGPGGYVAAVRCSQLGLKTAIVEKDPRLGGTCLLRGCIPTKALLESAHLYDKMRKAKNWGIKAEGVELDFTQVQKFRAKTVDKNSKGVDYLMNKGKIEILRGHGRIAGRGKLTVTADDGTVTTVDSKNIIIATGSVCKDLPFIEMDHVRTINSDDILEISEVPETLIVMGAGAVGTEFASIYNSFGSSVTLVEFQDRLLPIEDEDVSKELARSFKKKKIGVKTSTKITRVELRENGVSVAMEPVNGGAEEVMEADRLLVAVGRAPVTWDIGLDTVGIQTDDRGCVEVDDHCRTSVEGIYALGDAIATPWLAHVASHEGVMIAEQIAGKHVHPINYDHTPNCTYCDPEVGSVGLTEAKAKERGYDVKTGSFPFAASGKARIMGEADGMVKMVVDKEYNQLLGVHIIGPKATELIAEIVLGLELETTVEELAHAMHPHPTLSEAVGEAAHAALNGAALNFF